MIEHKQDVIAGLRNMFGDKDIVDFQSCYPQLWDAYLKLPTSQAVKEIAEGIFEMIDLAIEEAAGNRMDMEDCLANRF